MQDPSLVCFYEMLLNDERCKWLYEHWKDINHHFDETYFTLSRISELLTFGYGINLITKCWPEFRHIILLMKTEQGINPLLETLTYKPFNSVFFDHLFIDFVPLIQEYELNDHSKKIINNLIQLFCSTERGKNNLTQHWDSTFSRFMTLDELEKITNSANVVKTIKLSRSIPQLRNHGLFPPQREPALSVDNDLASSYADNKGCK